MIGIILATVLVSVPLVPPQVKDAQSLYEYEKKEFSYQNEDGDYWQTPEETLKDKGGMCADFAFYNEAVLTKMGYEAHAIAIYGRQEGKKVGHAITVIKMPNGKWRYTSNQFYSYFRDFESIKDIIDFEMPEWKVYCYIYLPHEQKDIHIKATSE